MNTLSAFTIQIPSVVVVKMDDDTSIDRSITTLKKNIPNVVVVEYQSFEFALKIGRTPNPVIWVGHGDTSGINTYKKMLSWEELAKKLLITPATDIILSCYSSTILEKDLVEDDSVFTFKTDIDCVLGAQIVSYIYNPSDRLAEVLIGRYLSLKSGKIKSNPLIIPGPIVLDPGDGGGITPPSEEFDPNDFAINLSYDDLKDEPNYAVYYFSWIELVYALVTFVYLVIDLALATNVKAMGWSFMKSAFVSFMAFGHVVLIMTWIYDYMHWISIGEVIANIVGIFWLVGELLVEAISGASIVEILAFVALVVIQLGIQLLIHAILDILTAGQICALRLVISTVLITAWLLNTIGDFLDQDSIAG